MNEVKLFENEEFGLVRTVIIDGTPWFVGNDVSRILGYEKYRDAVPRHVDEDDRKGIQIEDAGQRRTVTVINESGLYALIFGSQLPTAKKFKHWVTSEVLPLIRQTGGYSLQQRMPDSYTIEDPVERAKRWIEEQEEYKTKVAALNGEISMLKPKAEMCDKLLDASMLVNFRDAAKEIGISQTQFTGCLVDNGYVYMTSTRELRPMEPYMKSEFFQMKPYQNPYNGYKGSRTYITGRGLAAFKKLIDAEGHNRDTMKKHGGKRSSKTRIYENL